MCEPAPCNIYYVAVVVIVVVPTTYTTTGVACPRKAGLFIKQLEPSYYIILPTSILVQMYLYRCYTYIIYIYVYKYTCTRQDHVLKFTRRTHHFFTRRPNKLNIFIHLWVRLFSYSKTRIYYIGRYTRYNYNYSVSRFAAVTRNGFSQTISLHTKNN